MKLLGAGLLALSGFVQAASLVQEAPPRTASIGNPYEGQDSARRAGAKLFARECASCHGENGAGGLGKAPPLRQPGVYRAAPGTLFWILRNGSLHRGMPSFAHLPEPQRWQIVTWLKAMT
ncbi:MAG: cytochrome c [Acidobacteriota bacterium]|nr:cytochrome c [Acidobacteriota bacterium]